MRTTSSTRIACVYRMAATRLSLLLRLSTLAVLRFKIYFGDLGSGRPKPKNLKCEIRIFKVLWAKRMFKF